MSAEELKATFLETPDGERLVELYAAMLEEGTDDEIAEILDKVRPIQHRITLIQADASGPLLEVLCRDPHAQVRRVVASHAHVTGEVCRRLVEDQDASVRLALRKNEACHPVIRAALILREKHRDRIDALWEELVEIAWQASRADIDGDEVAELIEEWTGLDRDSLHTLQPEQTQLILQVLAAKLGQGKMPRKPRKRSGKKKTARKRKKKTKTRSRKK